MKFLDISIFIFGFAILQASSLDMKCKGLPVTMTEAQMDNIKACIKIHGVTGPPEQMAKEKIGCFSRCIMERKKLVDGDGKPHKENINALIDATLPEPAREAGKAAFGACLDKHGAGIDPKDATCGGYVPLAMCTRSAMMEVCK